MAPHSPAGVHVSSSGHPLCRRGPNHALQRTGTGVPVFSVLPPLASPVPVAELGFVRRSEAPVHVAAFQKCIRPSLPVGRLPLSGGCPSFPAGRPSFPAPRLPLPASHLSFQRGHLSLPGGRLPQSAGRLSLPGGRLLLPGGRLGASARPRVGARSRLTTRSSEQAPAGGTFLLVEPCVAGACR